MKDEFKFGIVGIIVAAVTVCFCAATMSSCEKEVGQRVIQATKAVAESESQK